MLFVTFAFSSFSDSRGLITTNGSSTDKFSWSQNRYEVIIQAIVPAGTKASEVVCV